MREHIDFGDSRLTHELNKPDEPQHSDVSTWVYVVIVLGICLMLVLPFILL